MQSCFAIFQLGVAIALEKFDAPEDAPEEEEKEEESEVENQGENNE